jgi:hypothetical protein
MIDVALTDVGKATIAALAECGDIIVGDHEWPAFVERIGANDYAVADALHRMRFRGYATVELVEHPCPPSRYTPWTKRYAATSKTPLTPKIADAEAATPAMLAKREAGEARGDGREGGCVMTWLRALKAVAVPVGDDVRYQWGNHTPALAGEKVSLEVGQSIEDTDLAYGYTPEDGLFEEVAEETALAGNEAVAAKLADERRGNLGDNEGVVSFNSPWFGGFDQIDGSSPNDLKGTPWTN